MQEKPRVFKSIVTALLGLVIFGLVYSLTYAIVGVVISLLSLVPLIGNLVDWLFYVRGDSPDMLLSILSPTIAFLCTMAALEAINKSKPTNRLACMILGIIMMVLHIWSLLINLLSGAGILNNIAQVIAGYLFFRSGKAENTDDSVDSSSIITE